LLAASVISLAPHDSFPVILILLFEQRSPIKVVNINGVGGRTMMA
jgi:hypothetical protein